MTSTWVREIPEIGAKFVERADAIEWMKQDALKRLAIAYKDEANLWQEIGRTGDWTQKEMAAALVKMDPAVLPYLPEQMPGKR